jgi:hypothetical protein
MSFLVDLYLFKKMFPIAYWVCKWFFIAFFVIFLLAVVFAPRPPVQPSLATQPVLKSRGREELNRTLRYMGKPPAKAPQPVPAELAK